MEGKQKQKQKENRKEKNQLTVQFSLFNYFNFNVKE